MKVEHLNTKNFYEALKIVGNAIPNKSAMPILTNVSLKFKNDKIIILGSDGTTAIKKVLFDTSDFTTKEEGNALVDYKTLVLIFSKLSMNITTLYKEGNQLVIENGKSVYRLNYADESLYPNIDFKKLDNEFSISTNELKNVINKLSICCATNSNKPILTGVNFKSLADGLCCVSTDALRLGKYLITNAENTKNEFEFTFPFQSLTSLGKIIEKTKQEKISVLYGSNNNDILINVDETLYKTRLLDGKYPDTSRLIPASFPYVVEVDRQEILRAVERISVLSNKSDVAPVIKLSFDKNSLTLSSLDNYIGNAKEVIDVNCDFELSLAVSSTYLTQALSTFDYEKVKFNLQNEVRPFIITDGITSLIQLLLPVKSE